MPAPINLSGKTFGRLIALRVANRDERRRASRSWVCRCECGNHIVVATQELIREETRSCGCLKHERTISMGRANHRHGHARTNLESPEYRSWVEMRRRCTNKNCIGSKHYGGRGIRVCDRWSLYETFLADMGPKPTPQHSIDRINNDGNYEPGNCRWATPKEQASNRRAAA